MVAVRAAIVDIGSNTARLVVVERHGSELLTVRSERVTLGLGADVERLGAISERKLAEAEDCLRRFTKIARREGAELVEALVTSPGRQASNGTQLADRLATQAGIAVSLLSAEEEGLLAWEGALQATRVRWRTVAVCDVGGGSTQIAVGEHGEPPTWVRSVDVGSLRMTRRLGGTPSVADAAAEAERCFTGLAPPLPEGALAVGGSARAVRKIVGRTLGSAELAAALDVLGRRSRKELVQLLDVEADRARTMLAGAAILAEVQRRLGVPLHVARGGLREGAACRLLAQLEAAA
jgi:exopolyphosphatase / guanosine-5'-triphosphate,3'-diphosphate pyrophosphatase